MSGREREQVWMMMSRVACVGLSFGSVDGPCGSNCAMEISAEAADEERSRVARESALQRTQIAAQWPCRQPTLPVASVSTVPDSPWALGGPEHAPTHDHRHKHEHTCPPQVAKRTAPNHHHPSFSPEHRARPGHHPLFFGTRAREGEQNVTASSSRSLTAPARNKPSAHALPAPLRFGVEASTLVEPLVYFHLRQSPFLP